MKMIIDFKIEMHQPKFISINISFPSQLKTVNNIRSWALDSGEFTEMTVFVEYSANMNLISLMS